MSARSGQLVGTTTGECPAPLSPVWTPGRARALKGVARLFYGAVARVRPSGVGNVPEAGPCVLVFNHLSNFDVHLIFSVLERPDVTGLVAADYRSRPVARVLVEVGGGIWLNRRRAGRAGIRAALELLRHGWLVGIAPEGGRSRTGALTRGRPGAAYLALRTGAAVIPVALTGTERLRRTLRRLQRPDVRVRFGEPFRPEPSETLPRRERIGAATEEIMTRLASLLPVEYRGVYRGSVSAVRTSAHEREG